MAVHVIIGVLLDLFVSVVEGETCYTYSYYYSSVRTKYCSFNCCGSYGDHSCCKNSTDDDYGWVAGVVVGVLILIGVIVTVAICVCIKKANARRMGAIQPNRGQTMVMVSGQPQYMHPTTTIGYVPPPQGQHQNPMFGQPAQPPPPPNSGFNYNNTGSVYPPPPASYVPTTKY